RAGPDHRRGDPAGHRLRPGLRGPHQRDRAAQEPDQGRRVALPVRADEAPADGLPGRGGGLVARRRRAARRPRSGFDLARFRLPDVGADVARSLVGITLLVLAAVTLIAFLPGEGSVTTWFRDTVGPWFGTLRWLLPFLLLATGWYVEWGPGKAPGSGWGLTVVGVTVAYVGILGAASVLIPATTTRGAGGGRVGTVLA